MLVIKRYPNRKLYNTETKRYITLDGIAQLIRAGEDVQVVDHTNGEDLTTLTLSQIIFEQEKKSSGFLPQAVLTGLIQSSGQKLESLRKTLMSPRELFETVETEIDSRISTLIKQGELAREEGNRLREKMLTNFALPDIRSVLPGVGSSTTEDSAENKPSPPEDIPVEEAPAAEPESGGDDSAENIKALTAQLDELTAKVNALLAEK